MFRVYKKGNKDAEIIMKTVNQDIKDKKFKRAYLLFGEEDYLKKSYRDRLIQAVSGGDTMNSSFYEGKGINIKSVIDMAETLPFLSEHRLMVLEDTGLFKSGGEELAEYIKSVPETTVFLFVESAVDKRSKMYKAVKGNGYICELGRQDEKSLGIWAAKIIAASGKKITQNNMSYLLAKVGTDMEVLSTELEKLISYCLEKEIIEKEDIDAVCTTQLSVKIFDMIDAISEKNQKKTLDAYYELLATKEPPMRILYMITRQFNLMLQAKDLNARGMARDQIAKAMGVQAFIASKSVNQSKNFSLTDLKNGLSESVLTEEWIKSGKMDENIGVEMLLVKYSRKK